MAVQFQIPLPPLRRKIRRNFLLVIGLYVLVCTFMMISVFLASGITPKIIHVNYDSIAAAGRMREAWSALQNYELYPTKSIEAWSSQFEQAIQFEEGNITEPNEGDITKNIRTLWEQTKSNQYHIDRDTFGKMSTYLNALVNVNEKGMFGLAENATAFSHKIFLMTLCIFIVTIIFAMLLADGLAVRLAWPIKQIAEAIRSNPSLSRRLKLPAPNSLEMRILTTEINELWTRLGHLQKLNVEELEAERERLETVLASIEDAVLVLDNQLRVLHVSDGMLKILALESKQLLMLPWNDLSTMTENYLKLRGFLNPDLPLENMIELKIESQHHTFAARYRDITTKNNQKIGLVYLLHDITETRQRERLKNEFIGVLSHELKTPLQSLGTAAELLLNRRDQLNDDTKMLADTINEDVSRIRAVANDFIQVSVVDLHSLKLKLERLPLSTLLQDWLKPFKVLARDKKVQIKFTKTGSEVIWANIDAVKFPWSISNLLANAIRISEADQVVSISISDRVSTEFIRIEISDEGPGIPPEIQARMFEPYYQAPATVSGTSSGFLGLGLTIAKEVVEAHEGKIEYMINRPHGSVFRITLPAVGVIS